jgi:dipeptidyl aminopeptidase/acylaminoacyl peptidase
LAGKSYFRNELNILNMTAIKLTLLLLLSLTFTFRAASQESLNYQLPPQEIIDMVDAPGTPGISFSPDASVMLILDRPELPTIEDLAMPEERLAGIRINPDNFGPGRSWYYAGMSLLYEAGSEPVPVTGLPENPRIRNLNWSANGNYIAFTHTHHTGIELWLLDVKAASVRKLSRRSINDVIGSTYSWFEPNESIIFAAVASDPGDKPLAPQTPTGPDVQENIGRQAAVRTYQDLLQTPHDAVLFEYFTNTQLVRVNIHDGKETLIGNPGLYSRFTPSPNAEYLLVQEIQKPFSFVVPWQRFALKVELWNKDGRLHKSLADITVSDNIPQGFGAVRTGPRSYTWQNDAPAVLWWVEALDGGNPATAAEFRDQLFCLQPPFTSEPVEGPKLAFRYSGVTWGKDDLAVVSQFWRQTRQSITMFFDPSEPAKETTVVFDRSTEDRYNDPGSFYTTSNASGQRVLLMDSGEQHLYLTGTGASPEGNLPFLDRMNIRDLNIERIWRCEAPYYEYVAEITGTEQMRFITRRESQDMQPNYYLRASQQGILQQITFFPDPFPALREISKTLIEYEREDGIPLSGNLYLPPGYQTSDGPLPTILWAYPREFKSADGAGQVSGSPHTFTRLGATSIVMMATQGYAVLNNASFPVVGEGDEEPNDTFTEQLVQNAAAAIEKLVEMGVADPERVAVGGHSYGAFMVANLLSHSDLFAAGLARSGAYNRTLTPFGFQAEERTYWQAPDIYHAMSPFSFAHQMKTPMLLIHGADDNNSGTFPMQSECYYQALRGHGATVRLVMLPLESHGYSARESVLHMHWETLQWLDRFVKESK